MQADDLGDVGEEDVDAELDARGEKSKAAGFGVGGGGFGLFCGGFDDLIGLILGEQNGDVD